MSSDDSFRLGGAGVRGGQGSRVALRVAVIALATAGMVGLAGERDAFWLCLPAVLLACASTQTRVGAAMSAAAVVASAAMPSVVLIHGQPLPSPLLALFIPAVSATLVVALRERLGRERDSMRDFALSDPLTGIANRRALLARAEYEIVRHTRAGRSFALVMLDIDHFKVLNDRFGHAAGDDLLRDFATALRFSIRAQDTVARLGGDEFCVLAPETSETGTHRLGARVAQAVAGATSGVAQAVAGATAGVEALRASLGIAVFPSDGVTATALLHAADLRLMTAKRGRQPGRAERRAA